MWASPVQVGDTGATERQEIMADGNQPGGNIPIWVPPGEHDRPKPGTPEWEEEMRRAREEGREPWSRPSAGSVGVSGQAGADGAADMESRPFGAAGIAASLSPASVAGTATSPPQQTSVPGGQGAARPVGAAGGTAAGAEKKSGSHFKTIAVVALVVLGVGGGLYGGYRLFIYFLEWSATKVPVSWDVELGKNAARDVLGRYSVCSNPRLNRFIDKLGKRLESGMPSNPYHFRFKVIQVKSINAFALPGGYVFIHTGLLEKADSAEEVAGVLAHEVQHVLLRHGTKRVVRKMGLFLALRLLFGDAGGMGGFLANGAASLASLKYDRGEETEADMGGLKLLYKAHLDPNGMPKFFEKMVEEEKKLGAAGKALLPIISDHPLSSERLARIRAYIRKHGTPADIVAISGFKEVKDLCDPVRISDPDKDFAAPSAPAQ